jgi:transposase-like protein
MISDVVDALQARPLRRRWSDDVKAQIVAESYAPCAVVSAVARRHEIAPQLLGERHGRITVPGLDLRGMLWIGRSR